MICCSMGTGISLASYRSSLSDIYSSVYRAVRWLAVKHGQQRKKRFRVTIPMVAIPMDAIPTNKAQKDKIV